MRGGCGSEVVLETVNATRAFLTTDSGFPLPDLEQALRTNRPFQYDFHPTSVPVLYGAEYWLLAKEKDARIHRCVPGRAGDVPSLPGALEAGPRDCGGVAQGDCRCRGSGRSRTCWISSARCSRFAAVRPWCRAARASVAAWAELAGASPEQGAAFFEKTDRAGTTAGWRATTMRWRASTVPCATT